MLKVLFASVLSLFMAGTAFAQTFTFETVNGFVAVSDGTNAATTAGQGGTIANGSVITTASDAATTIRFGTCTFTVPANSTVRINSAAGCNQNVVQLANSLAAPQSSLLASTSGAGFLNSLGLLSLMSGALVLNRAVANLDKSPK